MTRPSKLYSIYGYIEIAQKDLTDIVKMNDILNATEGGNLTIYHEGSKNISFCAVQPPFSLGSLRAQFQNGLVDSDVDITQVSRYSFP